MKFPTTRLLASIAFLVTTFPATFTHAATEFSDGLVPVEVVTDIVGGDIYRSLPDGFPLPGASLPAGMELRFIASRSRSFQQEVFLRTQSDADTFRLALADAYVAGGWTDVSYTPSDWSPAENAPLYVNLCHDELGSLSIDDNGSDNGEQKIQVLFRSADSAPPRINGANCAETKALNEAGYPSGLLSFFQEQVPLLEGPENSQGAAGDLGRTPFFGSSSSGGIGEQSFRSSRRGTLEVPDYLLVQMFLHMATQMEEQGWSLENNTSSNTASSSIWMKSVQLPTLPAFSGEPGANAADMDMTGILTILDRGENTWLVQFELWSE